MPGLGSRFTIVLPWVNVRGALDPLGQPVGSADECGEPAGEGSPTRRRTFGRGAAERGSVRRLSVSSPPVVLVADDSELTCALLKDFLEAQGCRVEIARHGAEALKLAHEARPAMILMDIQMPDVDGLEAIRRLRAGQDRQLADVPIIALTALSMPGDRELCLEAGADEYMSKPVNLRALCQIIQRYLELPQPPVPAVE